MRGKGGEGWGVERVWMEGRRDGGKRGREGGREGEGERESLEACRLAARNGPNIYIYIYIYIDIYRYIYIYIYIYTRRLATRKGPKRLYEKRADSDSDEEHNVRQERARSELLKGVG
jgi:hypothetical protein